MRITIVYRYFWPDTPPYAAMLRDISRWLAEAGHDVEVLTAQPAYKPELGIPRQPALESVDGVTIRRLPLLRENGGRITKALNAALFVAQAMLRLLRGDKPDIVWTATMPPVLQAFVMMTAAKLRLSGFLYHMQDIYPEVGIAGGVLANGPASRLLRWLDTRTLNRTDVNVVLSEDMKHVIEERGASPRQIRVINNYAWGRPARSQRPVSRAKGPARFVFAGNLGRFQNLEDLVEAFALVPSELAELHFMGTGRARSSLVAMVERMGLPHVRFHDHRPDDEALEFMQSCDVGIVSLTPGIYRYAYPSKTWTYMAAGLTMLAIVERDSELAKMITGRQMGSVAEWSDGAGKIGETIVRLASDIRDGKGATGRSDRDHLPERARGQWLTLFESLKAERAAP